MVEGGSSGGSGGEEMEMEKIGIVRSCTKPKNSYIGDSLLAPWNSGNICPLTKKANVSEEDHRNPPPPPPPVPRSIDIMSTMIGYQCPFFLPKIKYQAPDLSIF